MTFIVSWSLAILVATAVATASTPSSETVVLCNGRAEGIQCAHDCSVLYYDCKTGETELVDFGKRCLDDQIVSRDYCDALLAADMDASIEEAEGENDEFDDLISTNLTFPQSEDPEEEDYDFEVDENDDNSDEPDIVGDEEAAHQRKYKRASCFSAGQAGRKPSTYKVFTINGVKYYYIRNQRCGGVRKGPLYPHRHWQSAQFVCSSPQGCTHTYSESKSVSETFGVSVSGGLSISGLKDLYGANADFTASYSKTISTSTSIGTNVNVRRGTAYRVMVFSIVRTHTSTCTSQIAPRGRRTSGVALRGSTKYEYCYRDYSNTATGVVSVRGPYKGWICVRGCKQTVNQQLMRY